MFDLNFHLVFGSCCDGMLLLSYSQLVLRPFHIAVFSVEITVPDIEGTFSAEVIFNTQFEVCHATLHNFRTPELVTCVVIKTNKTA